LHCSPPKGRFLAHKKRRAPLFLAGPPGGPLSERDWYVIAEQPAPAPHLAHPEGCADLHIVLVTVPRVSRSCEHFPDGFDLHLLASFGHCSGSLSYYEFCIFIQPWPILGHAADARPLNYPHSGLRRELVSEYEGISADCLYQESRGRFLIQTKETEVIIHC